MSSEWMDSLLKERKLLRALQAHYRVMLPMVEGRIKYLDDHLEAGTWEPR